MAIYLLRSQILDIKLVDTQMKDASNQFFGSSLNFRALTRSTNSIPTNLYD